MESARPYQAHGKAAPSLKFDLQMHDADLVRGVDGVFDERQQFIGYEKLRTHSQITRSAYCNKVTSSWLCRCICL